MNEFFSILNIVSLITYYENLLIIFLKCTEKRNSLFFNILDKYYCDVGTIVLYRCYINNYLIIEQEAFAIKETLDNYALTIQIMEQEEKSNE